MTELYTFSRDAIRQVAREVFREERELRAQRHQTPGIVQPITRNSVQFRNASGEAIPGYAVMRVTGAEIRAGLPIITVAKPSTTFQRLYLVNGPNRVGSGSQARGVGSWLDDEPGFVLYESGTPAVGESWGPKAGQWSLAKWRYGFTVIGGLAGSGSTARVVAKQEEVNEFIGKTDASHAKNATGTVSIYDGNFADTSDNMTSVENKFAAVGSGKWVGVRWWGGKWNLTAAEC